MHFLIAFLSLCLPFVFAQNHAVLPAPVHSEQPVGDKVHANQTVKQHSDSETPSHAPSADKSETHTDSHADTGKSPLCPVDEHDVHDANESLRYQVVSLNWHHVATPFSITLWLLLAGFAKIGFHMSQKLVTIFPDSSLLIVLGLIVGIPLFYIFPEESFHLDSTVFFLFLIPPIMLDAGYFMPSRAFFDNLGTILMYAVVGTVWNTLTIGLSLWGVALTGMFGEYVNIDDSTATLMNILVFAALISAVDPVAVIVVFEEIQVNETLYISVFGESILNDAVTVVLYNMFVKFAEIYSKKEITGGILPRDVGLGLVSFFVVGLGGVLIGIIWAFICSFTVRFTKHTRILEPLFIFAMAYAAYMTAELFHLSGILAIVFCGISMRQYVERNISDSSKTTIRYFLKMLCSCSETVIFMFLGLSTISKEHVAEPAFICLTVLFCLVYRAVGVIGLTFIANRGRVFKYSKVEQFIMAYGGLRGAIAYGLVAALDSDQFKERNLFITTTLVVVFFTVFLQGMTIKPLVNFLRVKKQEHRERSLNEEIFSKLSDLLMSGIEDISGRKSHANYLRTRFEYYDNKYIKPLLMNDPDAGGLVETFTQQNLRAAIEQVEQYGSLQKAAEMQQANVPVSQLIRMQQMQNGGQTVGHDNPMIDMRALDNRGSIQLDIDGFDTQVIQPKPNLGRRYSRHADTFDDDQFSAQHRAGAVPASTGMRAGKAKAKAKAKRAPPPTMQPSHGRRYSRHADMFDDDDNLQLQRLQRINSNDNRVTFAPNEFLTTIRRMSQLPPESPSPQSSAVSSGRQHSQDKSEDEEFTVLPAITISIPPKEPKPVPTPAVSHSHHSHPKKSALKQGSFSKSVDEDLDDLTVAEAELPWKSQSSYEPDSRQLDFPRSSLSRGRLASDADGPDEFREAQLDGSRHGSRLLEGKYARGDSLDEDTVELTMPRVVGETIQEESEEEDEKDGGKTNPTFNLGEDP